MTELMGEQLNGKLKNVIEKIKNMTVCEIGLHSVYCYCVF